VSGTLKDPGIGTLDPDEPVLRYVDLSTTHISQAVGLETPTWARSVIPGPRGSPLLYSGVRDGVNTAVLAFEPRRSDLPLQVAFPILMANLTGELLGSTTAPTEAVEPGAPVELRIPTGAIGLSVTDPAGAVSDLRPTPGASTARTVTFAATDRLGIYTVTPIAAPDGSPAPAGGDRTPGTSAPPSGSPSAESSASPGASASPVTVDPLAPVRFVVDLFDVDESTIAPGSATTIEALGGAPAASPGPGSSGKPIPSAQPAAPAERPMTRDELWVPIVLAVLAALCLEWALYHRDGLVRVRRALAARRGRDDGAPA
jgi:hypothetical protein